MVTRTGNEEKWNAKSFALTGLSLFHYLPLNSLWTRLDRVRDLASSFQFLENSLVERRTGGGSDFLQFSYEFFERRLSVNC